VNVYSYVVEHDTGKAPNPYFGFCTLCRCKFRKCDTSRKNIVELAEPKKKNWVIGTGGANLRKSAGHGKLVFAMQVDEKLTREEYYNKLKFKKKKPGTCTDEQKHGDNEEPHGDFEKHKQFVLVSHPRHFYYFGEKAVDIPKKFDLEKKGPGFRSNFDQKDILRFVEWLKKEHKPGKHGEPCFKGIDELKGNRRCKSSC